MRDEEVDQVLQNASTAAPRVEPAVLQGIADSIISSLRPVRPMPPTWLLTGGLALTGLAVACGAGALTSFIGFRNLNLGARALIFSTLAILVWGAGSEFVRQWIPGSRQRLMPVASLTIGIAILLGVFAWVFRDYHTDHFIAAGITCLLMGMLLAVPAGLLSWLLLRRGFAVNSVAAGVAGGALAGLCGVTLLELHCPNFQAAHILVWHTGVVPVSAAIGALAGWLTNRRPREVDGRKRR